MSHLLLRVLPFVAFMFTLCIGQATTAITPTILQDSLPFLEKTSEYSGNRLAMSRMEIIKTKGNTIKIKYNLVNTGRNNITMQGKSAPKNLVINFDESLETSGLAPHALAIREQLRCEEISIKTGQVQMNNQLKIKVKKEDADNQLAHKGKDKAKKETTKRKDKSKNKSKNKSKDEAVFTDAVGKTNANKYLDDNFCADLVLTELKVLKKSKKWITLEYTIQNQGKGPAAMLGDKKSDSDNVAIKVYIAGSPKISRGSLVLGGEYLTKGFKDRKGLIPPQESYTASIKLDFRKKTRFTPFVIVELDSFQNIKECDETNNTKEVLVK